MEPGRWYSYGPGGPINALPEDIGQELLRRRAERADRRGRLQAIVQVYVYENGQSQAQVSFSPECALSPDSDAEEIAQAVQTARDALTSWR